MSEHKVGPWESQGQQTGHQGSRAGTTRVRRTVLLLPGFPHVALVTPCNVSVDVATEKLCDPGQVAHPR